MTITQPFSEQGNFTQVHNAAFDHIMPLVSGSAWKILCLIIRKTKGWHKDEDDIAYSQLKKGTGIKSDATIKKAIDELLSFDVIQVGKPRHQADPHAYRLNKSFSCRTSKNEDSTPKKWSTSTSKNEDTKDTNTKESNKYIEKTMHTREYIPDPVQEVVNELAATCKTPYWAKTETEYNEAAYMIFGYDCTVEDVKEFGAWWDERGYYTGKPALTTLLNEWSNYKTPPEETKKYDMPEPIFDPETNTYKMAT